MSNTTMTFELHINIHAKLAKWAFIRIISNFVDPESKKRRCQNESEDTLCAIILREYVITNCFELGNQLWVYPRMYYSWSYS